jgi:F-type H+-transporting ATPase subunit delta
VHPALRGYATAVVGQAVSEEAGARLADELGAVARLVAHNGDLAVTLTDFAVPLPARKAVLADLLGSRVHPLVLRVVLWALETERADEIITVLHDLHELVRRLYQLPADEIRAEEPILGRTPWRQYASGFAAAVFEGMARTEEIEEIEDELFRFARIVESTPSLRAALADPTASPQGRRALIEDLLRSKAAPATVRLASLVVEGHVRDVVSALDWLVEQAARARGWRVARVRAARPVDDDERRALGAALERITGQPVELQVAEDPSLLGGAVVQVGDLLVDASVQHRLDQLSEHLLGTEGTRRGASS